MNKFTLCLLGLAIIIPNLTYGQNKEQGEGPIVVLLEYLENKNATYTFQDEDLENLVVTNSYESKSTGIQHVYLNQTYDGVKIFNAISSLAIKNNQIVHFGNRFVDNLRSRINSNRPNHSPINAIRALANSVDIGPIQDLELLEENENRYQYTAESVSKEIINVELVYVKVEETLKLAWSLKLYLKDNSHWWTARIDAMTNVPIEVNDLILSCAFEKNHKNHHHSSETSDVLKIVNQSASMLADGSNYNVFALPTESPNHGTRQLVNNPANIEASPFGWHDVDGVTGAEFTVTRGNNVWAKEDFEATNSLSGFAPDGTASLNFDFPLNFNDSPLDYQAAAITNLFYVNNMMHDIWYNHGFDEAAGNFQANNYGNPGFQNDFVFADAQDGSRFNNANFGTPPDGFNPRMQMFLWSPPGAQTSPLAIIENGRLVEEFPVVSGSFGMSLIGESITSNLVLATDATPDILDVCEPITNSADLNGNIAILRRGQCQFGAKALAAENAGAIAVIIVNNVDEPSFAMAPGEDGGAVTIPTVMMNLSNGEMLIAALQSGDDIILTLQGPDVTDFIDGDFDNLIIAHEYGHGISNRLAGGPSAADCLFNDEQMGEGWSDWFGLMLTMTAEDTPDDPRGIGTFAISQSTTGGGIRPRRYSPDFAINELTYGITNNLNLRRPHGIGSVWATVLWDLTWSYIDKYGFDSDLYNGDGGNNKIMRLVIEGLKLQPCSPGFIDGRDALLAADALITGGVDQCMIWEVFAARGMGFNATQGDPTSRLDQIEDFSTPPSGDASLANCSSLSVDEVADQFIRVFPNPTESELSIYSSKNLGLVTLQLVDINGREILKLKKELFSEIRLNMNQLQSGLYILNIIGDRFSFNKKIIKN